MYPSNWYGTGRAQAEPARAVQQTETARQPSPSLNLRSPRELRHRPHLIRYCRSLVRTQKDLERPAHHHGKCSQRTPYGIEIQLTLWLKAMIFNKVNSLQVWTKLAIGYLIKNNIVIFLQPCQPFTFISSSLPLVSCFRKAKRSYVLNSRQVCVRTSYYIKLGKPSKKEKF